MYAIPIELRDTAVLELVFTQTAVRARCRSDMLYYQLAPMTRARQSSTSTDAIADNATSLAGNRTPRDSEQRRELQAKQPAPDTAPACLGLSLRPPT